MSRVTKNIITKILEDRFGKGIPIVDATDKLRMQPMPCDKKGADPKSIDNCLLVHTAQRQYGSKAAVFFKSTAYVDLLDKRGERRLERFSLTTEAKRIAGNFDRGKPFKIGTAIVLLPPSGKKTLKHIRKVKAKYNATPAGQSYYMVGSAMQVVDRAEAHVERVREEAASAKPGDREVKFRVRDARVRLREAKAKLAQAHRAAAKVKKLYKKPRRMKPQFDLATRNGAIGNYHFVTV